MASTQQIRPSVSGTFAILLSCVIGYVVSLMSMQPADMARAVAITLLAGIGGSFLLDWRHGLRNLLRVDVFALLALYFLTFFEFLFPQSQFNLIVIPGDAVIAVQLVLMGFVAMIVGRHLAVFPKSWLDKIGEIRMQDRDFLIIFFGATVLNFLPTMIAVDFNPVAWFEGTLQPRFSRPWGRGRYGDLSSLLHELQLLGYVMPPIAGVIFARWRAYNKLALVLVAFFTLVLLYFGFASGTRNILAVQIAGLLAGFFVVQKELKLKFIIPTVVFVGFAFVILSNQMLEFRNVGLERYVEMEMYKPEYQEFKSTYLEGMMDEEPETGYFVDYNLYRISQMVAAFPGLYNHLGFNLPYVALTKPIPRAFWPGKPTDLEVGLEEAIGVDSMTVAVTWVGEAYVAGGWVWVIAVGVLIGAFCGFWNRLANFLQAPFPLLVFASGFYAVLLLMRSVMFFTTALLPSIALIIMGAFLYKNRSIE